MLCETNAGDQVKTRSCVNCYAPPGVSLNTQVSQELCTSCIGIRKSQTWRYWLSTRGV